MTVSAVIAGMLLFMFYRLRLLQTPEMLGIALAIALAWYIDYRREW